MQIVGCFLETAQIFLPCHINVLFKLLQFVRPCENDHDYVLEIHAFFISRIKQHLQEIQSHVTTCPQLLDESPGLQLLQIEGVDMTALFTDFDNIDAFCGESECVPTVCKIASCIL